MILRKISIVTFALSAQALMAGTMGPVCSDKDSTACKASLWEVGGSALYLQPVNNSFKTAPLNGSDLAVGKDFPWSWGFKLEAAYHYTQANDLALNWSRVNTSMSGHSSLNTPNIISFGLLGKVTVESLDTQYAAAQNWDAVNIELGRRVDFGEQDTLRFYGGGQYVRLKNSESTHADARTSADTILLDIPSSPTNGAISQASTYNGFGPRIGADLSHTLAYGVSLYAKGATAVLAGNNNASLTSTVLDNPTSTIKSNAVSVVPEFEAKLGATYDYSSFNGALKFDAGWMWITYLNLRGINKFKQDDFSIEGPYIGMKWVGQVM